MEWFVFTYYGREVYRVLAKSTTDAYTQMRSAMKARGWHECAIMKVRLLYC